MKVIHNSYLIQFRNYTNLVNGSVLIYIISHITCSSPFTALMSTPGFGLVPYLGVSGSASCERCLCLVVFSNYYIFATMTKEWNSPSLLKVCDFITEILHMLYSFVEKSCARYWMLALYFLICDQKMKKRPLTISKKKYGDWLDFVATRKMQIKTNTNNRAGNQNCVVSYKM
jgi:hypothetical protein